MKKMSYLIHFGKEFLCGTKLGAIHPNVLYTMKDLVSEIRGELNREFLTLLEGLDLPECFLQRLEERKVRIREILSGLRKPIGTEMLDSFAVEDDGKSLTAESAFEDLKTSLSDVEIRYAEFVQLQKTFRADVLSGRVPELSDRALPSKPPPSQDTPNTLAWEQKLISEVVSGLEALDRAKGRPTALEVPPGKQALAELSLFLQDLKNDPLFGFTQCAFQLIRAIAETVRDLEGHVMDLVGKLLYFRQRGKSSIDDSLFERDPQFSALLSIIQNRHKKSQFTLLDDRFESDVREILVEWRTSNYRIGSFELEKPPSSKTESREFPLRPQSPSRPPDLAEESSGFCRLYCNIF